MNVAKQKFSESKTVQAVRLPGFKVQDVQTVQDAAVHNLPLSR
jgi:hypothetical protein